MFTPNKTEVISLFPDRPNITLTAYVAGTHPALPFNDKRKAILILPGGGYTACAGIESEPIAHHFLASGFNAFILEYTTLATGSPLWPTPLIDASAAMKYIRDHAEELHVDPENVFVIGFSAGGHLAASLGTMWDNDEIEALLGMEKGYNRPTGMILSYAVTSIDVHGHKSSFQKILGNNRDSEAERAVSPDYRVSEKTVPAFIWHTRTDEGVSVKHALVFAKRLADHNIPFEMHIYPEGKHGTSLCNEIVGKSYPAVNDWTYDCVRWMNDIAKSNAAKQK
ncbi:MAG: alpha/beta hydrolase [Clostridia bacterium]|nr:alpha/beta hydrolase [Clostridia bacterium]